MVGQNRRQCRGCKGDWHPCPSSATELLTISKAKTGPLYYFFCSLFISMCMCFNRTYLKFVHTAPGTFRQYNANKNWQYQLGFFKNNLQTWAKIKPMAKNWPCWKQSKHNEKRLRHILSSDCARQDPVFQRGLCYWGWLGQRQGDSEGWNAYEKSSFRKQAGRAVLVWHEGSVWSAVGMDQQGENLSAEHNMHMLCESPKDGKACTDLSWDILLTGL